MAGIFVGPMSKGGGAGGTAYNGVPPGASTQQSTSTSNTTFENPQLVNALASLMGSLSNFGASNFQDYISNPTASPLFQTLLQGALAKLAPSEDLARRNLTDQFRAAGGLRSGAYGNAAGGLEESILNNRGQTLANTLDKTYAPTLNALLNPVDQIASIIAALKGTSANSSSSGTSVGYPPSSGSSSSRGGGGSIGATPYYDSLLNRGGPVNVSAPSGGYGYGGGGVSNNGQSQILTTPDDLSGYSDPYAWMGGNSGLVGGGTGGGYSEYGGLADIISQLNNTSEYNYNPDYGDGF